MAMARLEVIFDSKPGTPEGDELEDFRCSYRQVEWSIIPIGYPDPIEAIIIPNGTNGL